MCPTKAFPQTGDQKIRHFLQTRQAWAGCLNLMWTRPATLLSRVASHVAGGFPPVITSCLSRNEDVLAEGHQKMSWADPVAHCDCCLIDSRDEDGKQLLVSPSQSPNCARSKATAHAELPGLAGKKSSHGPCGITSRSSLKNSLSKRNLRSQVHASPGLACWTRGGGLKLTEPVGSEEKATS